MAALVRRSQNFCRIIANCRHVAVSSNVNNSSELVTHTGQQFNNDDYRKVRFEGKNKLVNTRFAVDLVAEDPVVVCTERVVFSDGGGALGHPRVFINLDQPGFHICGYSGRRFVLKKYYDAATMGPSVTYEEYLKEANPQPDLYSWPN